MTVDVFAVIFFGYVLAVKCYRWGYHNGWHRARQDVKCDKPRCWRWARFVTKERDLANGVLTTRVLYARCEHHDDSPFYGDEHAPTFPRSIPG